MKPLFNPCACVRWWPILFGPLVVVTIYVARSAPWLDIEWFGRRVQDNSPLPYVLTLSAFGVALYRATVRRNPVMALLAAMALAIFNREVHWFMTIGDSEPFSPTSTMAYLTLAAVLLIGFRWRQRLAPYLRDGRLAQWLIMTAATYVFAVAVGKGWIKFMLPDERAIRSYLEESTENAAHVMLLLTSFMGWRRGSVAQTSDRMNASDAT